jgi:hypothetical protein
METSSVAQTAGQNGGSVGDLRARSTVSFAGWAGSVYEVCH